MSKQRVLFVCIHNSARSQMAEAWLRYLASDQFEVESAGLEPGKLNPFAIEAMKEKHIDMACHYPKGIDEILASGRKYDYVVAVCDKEAAERCPIFPGGGERLHWNFPDPSAVVGPPDEKLARAREVRELIRARLVEWLGSLGHTGCDR